MTILIKGVMLDGKILDILLEDGVIREISDNCIKTTDKVISGKTKPPFPLLSTDIPMQQCHFSGDMLTTCP